MSETFFRINLAEIVMLRVACKQCGAVLELPLQKLALMSGHIECPACRRSLQALTGQSQRSPDADVLTRLAEAVMAAQSATNASVELSIPIQPQAR